MRNTSILMILPCSMVCVLSTTNKNENETKQNITKNVYKLAPLLANRLSRADQHENAFFGLSSICPSRHVRIYTTACRSPAVAFSAVNQLTMKHSAPCSSVLRHSPSSWVTVLYWSSLLLKTLRSSRRHSAQYFSCPPHTASSPIPLPNTTQFDSLVSSMRATNPANSIRLLRIIASTLSLPVFMEVSK